MGQVRNDFGEVRVMPTLDYSGVEPGRVLEIPDEDVYHWVAGGWTPLTRYPVPHRLYPNHSDDELAYALPEPDDEDPSAIAVGAPAAAPSTPPPPAVPAAAPQVSAATAPAAAPVPAPAAPAPAGTDAKE
jgi:hypothetical protein